MIPFDKNKDEHKELVRAVTNFIVSGAVSIYTVDKPSFRNMLAALEPRFQCPSRKFFSNTAIPALYNSMKSELVSQVNNLSAFSITTDGWSSIAGDPYMSLSIHFIDSEWLLQTRCLATMYLPKAHTAETICDFIREVLLEYDLYLEQKVFITTDSATNNGKACKDMDVNRLSCFGHILHNALNTAMEKSKDITALVKAVRKTVSVFSYSHGTRKKLTKVKKDMGIDEKALIQDVSTRRGSKFKMRQRFYVQYRAVNEVFVNSRKHRDLILSQSQIDLLGELIPCLEPFSVLTDLSGDQNVTLSSIAPTLKRIQNICKANEDDDRTESETTKLKKAVWSYICSKFKDKNINLHIAAALFLNRRYVYRSPQIEEWPTEVKNFICSSVSVESECEPSGASTSHGQTSSQSSTNEFHSLVDFLIDDEEGKRDIVYGDEVDTSQSRISKEIDFLQAIYQKITNATDILSCGCATSVTSERIFSLADHIVSKKRSCLKPEMVNMLTSLAFNGNINGKQ
ncbi:E3 SUMO-protein ligase ZBED1-like [Watersipora subatra]|uniref:E3 SUMO-protein ligase ZBED1-like n=1 Tax=Watersipora subatra TaxID=2589382 RepID=UPI00355C1095